MELLLFLLFILFSMFSALMERRKRRKQVEEAQAQQEARRKRREEVEDEVVSAPQPVIVEEKKEEEEETSFGWPFEGDPFEDFRPAKEPEQASPENEGRDAERAALDAERRALDAERRALAMERMSLETGPEGGISDRFHRAAAKRSAAPRLKLGRWRLDARRARDAVVYMEILGKPKAEHDGERRQALAALLPQFAVAFLIGQRTAQRGAPGDGAAVEREGEAGGRLEPGAAGDGLEVRRARPAVVAVAVDLPPAPG